MKNIHMQCWFQTVYGNLGEGLEEEDDDDEEYVVPDDIQLQEGR